MRQRVVTAICIVCGVLMLSGCMPMALRYNHLDGVGVEHRPSLCPTYGPPGRAVMKQGDVEIIASLNKGGPSRLGSVSVSAPLGARIELVQNSIRISEPGRSDARELSLKSLPPNPLPPGVKPSPRMREIVYFGFSIPDDLAEEGSVELPAIRINDAVLPARRLNYTRKTWLGNVPLNC